MLSDVSLPSSSESRQDSHVSTHNWWTGLHGVSILPIQSSSVVFHSSFQIDVGISDNWIFHRFIIILLINRDGYRFTEGHYITTSTHVWMYALGVLLVVLMSERFDQKISQVRQLNICPFPD